MKKKNQEIWAGTEDKLNSSEWKEIAGKEFRDSPTADDLSGVTANRRDFLKLMGFGLGAATIAAGCDTPVRKAIPYVVKPDEIVPGVASYYASTYANGGDYCAVLVKTREGRPIKIEGNSLSPVTKGGTHARVQASVLDLYNTNRIKDCGSVNGNEVVPMSWADLDKVVGADLQKEAQIRIVSKTILSPSAKKALAEFQASYPNTKVVTYDPVSSSAMLLANEQSFGQRAIPAYHFDKAQVIVSFGADFLGTWISPVEYASQYATNRKVKGSDTNSLSWHVQVESAMTLTGSNADNRILVKPSEQGVAIAALYNELASKSGAPTVSAPAVNEKAKAALKRVAERLMANKGKSLVVSASNNTGEQILVNAVNDLLGNYGQTIDFTEASHQRQGIDPDVRALVREMNGGSVDALFVMGANPAFDLPDASAFIEGMKKVPLRVSFNTMMDETTSRCNYVAPDHHYLESWGDAEPRRGHFSLMQPTIAPLYRTRQAPESLLRWAGSANLNTSADQAYYEYVKWVWQTDMFPTQSAFATFRGFWEQVLHDGVYHADQTPVSVAFNANISQAASKISKPNAGGLEVSLHECVNMGSGEGADNPWLMEMPDPITRTVWGNYLMLPLSYDADKNEFIALNGLKNFMDKADKADLQVGGNSAQCTVVPQFGQMAETVSINLGYGREVSGRCGAGVGVNAWPWLSVDGDGHTQYFATGANLSERTGQDDEFACVQYHHTMGVTGEVDGEEINVDERAAINFISTGYQGSLTNRSIIFQGSADELDELTAHIHEKRSEYQKLNDNTLYPDYSGIYGQGHHWGMYVDLNACTGCGACTVACMAENNVPVVGKREVHRHHEMTWLRIDRYFYGDAENPNTVYQPLMCQHCDNAPCENVCPVNATNHSSEGLNQMAYNRCIGTRYCANNCPYKVRRFNWLDFNTADVFPANENYPFESDEPFYADNIVRMVLNPDVTVRSRGVIEKCSFCVQRIQEGKLTAKRDERRLRDNDVKTACQTSCPTGAIVFGDRNDKEGLLSKRIESPLVYRVLEEVNTQSSVFYAARVNNKDQKLEA